MSKQPRDVGSSPEFLQALDTIDAQQGAIDKLEDEVKDLMRANEQLLAMFKATPDPPGQTVIILVHTAKGHPVYAAKASVGLAREASADDASTYGAKSSILVQGVDIPLDEELDEVLRILGWP